MPPPARSSATSIGRADVDWYLSRGSRHRQTSVTAGACCRELARARRQGSQRCACGPGQGERACAMSCDAVSAGRLGRGFSGSSQRLTIGYVRIGPLQQLLGAALAPWRVPLKTLRRRHRLGRAWRQLRRTRSVSQSRVPAAGRQRRGQQSFKAEQRLTLWAHATKSTTEMTFV